MTFRSLFAKEGLSLDRLRALVQVDDAGGIAAVAPVDRSRQSQLSRQLGELERFFDIELKRKEGRTVQLTAEGRRLAALARAHLQSLDDFRREVAGQPVGVSLAAGAALHHWLVLPRLRRLREQTRSLVWQLHTRKNATMAQQLLDGSLDFGLLRSDLVEKYGEEGASNGNRGEHNGRPSLAGAPLGVLTYSVFVPDAVWPRSRPLPLGQALAELPIATQGDDTLFQLTLESAVSARKLKLNAVIYAETFTQVASAVAGETVAGILPDIAGATFDPAKVWPVSLGGWDELRRSVLLAWNPARIGRFSVLAKAKPVLAGMLRF